MAKDHYVARTYLRQFSISGKDGFVNVVRKKNLEHLEAIPVGSICYEKNGSDNHYFPDNPRVVEDYLKLYEPRWAECVLKVSEGTYTNETKSLMAGYIAYLRTHTPTAMRLGTEGCADFVKHVYDKLEGEEYSKSNPKYRDVIETIRKHSGTKIDVNKKYPVAIGITNLINIQDVIAQSPWIVFKNETSLPFLTSDNPVCLQYHKTGFADFYCPLTLWLAIVIHPTREHEKADPDHIGSFKPEGVEKMNQLIVQSAEDLVVCSDLAEAKRLVEQFQDWRVELQKIKIPSGNGHVIIHQQKPFKKGTCNSMELVNV
jgi:hypothetical protein